MCGALTVGASGRWWWAWEERCARGKVPRLGVAPWHCMAFRCGRSSLGGEGTSLLVRRGEGVALGVSYGMVMALCRGESRHGTAWHTWRSTARDVTRGPGGGTAAALRRITAAWTLADCIILINHLPYQLFFSLPCFSLTI